MFACAVHRGEPLTVKHEISEHDGSFFLWRLSGAVADNRAAFGVIEYGKIEVGGFFCFAANIADEQKKRNDDRPLLGFGVWGGDLPQQPIFILYPAVAFTEWIFIERHQYIPAR